jgi:hypothetical protein
LLWQKIQNLAVETVVEKKMKAKVAVRITTKRHLRKVDLQRAKENQGTVEGLAILVDAEAKARITRKIKAGFLLRSLLLFIRLIIFSVPPRL